ncbi:MAG: hypothetical protein WCE63_21610 [Acidobacteriaceae bacterium]
MTTHTKSAFGAALSVVLLFGVAACHGKPSPSTATQTSASQNDPGDPADANNAPVNGPASAYDNGAAPTVTQAPSNQSYSSQPAPPQQYSQNEPPLPPPDQAGYAQGGYDQSPYAQGYDDAQDQQEVYAPEPPPTMPEYEQPYCPGNDYIWTPGYWFWSPAGYYWVPGAWVLAPYIGALWTPGYWGFAGGRYGWHYGYWGPYIGFYGGINYGYGYFGNGYQGGYWNRRTFYYNRSITRVNNNVRYVYTRNVSYNNRTRVSYNGGRGGLNVRPNQSQLNAAKARRFGAIPAQRQLVHQAQGNRAQFAKTNNGKPAQVAYTRPVNGGRKAPAARPQDFRPAVGTRPVNNARPATGTHPTNGGKPVNGGRPVNTTRPAPSTGHPANGNPTPERPVTHPAQPRPETRPAQPRPETRPAQPRPETRPAPQPRPESRPAPQPRPESRPAPQQYRPAQQTHPESRPAPQPRPDPQAKPETRPAPQRQQDNRGPN